ncbi:hypothetical protein BDY19DRAFT_950775 [Irpex rosettiformis]|uniref:Uncharacterized protein n=1 Tax=Irpex rosettiformis TaxID=378272 RepID=A0ACB8U2V8_9APHY|nr:hypothetical protein BDY19DRAFT_950775 [Irpex rosettiformis]
MSEAFKNIMQDRKISYKTPPASIRDASTSQEARRKKALEEQKRRRAERFDSSRQLDFFADLNLGPSDDDDEDAGEPMREGVAQFASLLPPQPAVTPGFTTDSNSGVVVAPSALVEVSPMQDALPPLFGSPKKKGKTKRKGKGKGKINAQSSKPNTKWAEKCMYAELLEMTQDSEMSNFDGTSPDGIPVDLENGWVAVAPVPVGKRCLAITHAPSGIAGIVPNTTLRSRVLGKSLMKPFPSSLPPHTVLDCILDENWRSNGILHILDVIKWKGQDIADCETPFRFWWRDTRMSELSTFPPPNATTSSASHRYQFPYPTTLLCVPYHQNLAIPNLLDTLIPSARSTRQILIDIPVQSSTESDAMEIEQTSSTTQVELVQESASMRSDGILLYVAQATYEPGTSPLSLWIPVKSYSEERTNRNPSDVPMDETSRETPLDVFERLIRRRLT